MMIKLRVTSFLVPIFLIYFYFVSKKMHNKDVSQEAWVQNSFTTLKTFLDWLSSVK